MAQSSGMVRGVVRDDKGQPVEGAEVTIEITGGHRPQVRRSRRTGRASSSRSASLEAPTPCTAEKDKLASATETGRRQVGAPRTSTSCSAYVGAAAAADAKELAAKGRRAEEGVRGRRRRQQRGTARRGDREVQRGIAINPNCYDCYNNIGFAYTQKKEFDKAEAAYKKATEIKPDDAAAWNGLADVYNAQRKFDLAAEASAKATELSTSLVGDRRRGRQRRRAVQPGRHPVERGQDRRSQEAVRGSCCRPIRTTPKRITSSAWRS